MLGQSLADLLGGYRAGRVRGGAGSGCPPAASSGVWSYVLPGFTLGWFVVAGLMRLLRSGMLEVLDSEYVKLARVKGVVEHRVIWIHALRNALIPVVTFPGIYFSILVTTAIVVETVFAWPGLGRLAYDGISRRLPRDPGGGPHHGRDRRSGQPRRGLPVRAHRPKIRHAR